MRASCPEAARPHKILVDMSDRAFLFIFSCAVILACLGASIWLIASGQAGYVDGLFLLLMCLSVGFAFGLYIMFMIRRAMESLETPAAAKVAKPAPAAQPKAAGTPAKAAPLVSAEKTE